MPLIRIEHYPGLRQVFIASEEIGHLATICYSAAGPNYVALGTNAEQAKVCGVAYGATSGVVSGKNLRAVVEGIVSGLVCAIAVNAGDRVAVASAGKIAPLNTIQPAISGRVTGAISGYIPAGGTGLTSGIQTASGIISGFTTISTPPIFSSGSLAGVFSSGLAEALNTARILGKALASGAADAGIPVLVTLGG